MLYHFSLLHNSLSSCFLPLLLLHTVSITIIWLWSWCWRRFCTFGSICLKGLISFFFEPLFSPILFSTLCILAHYLFLFLFVLFLGMRFKEISPKYGELKNFQQAVLALTPLHWLEKFVLVYLSIVCLING